MSIITMPSNLFIGQFAIEQISFDTVEASDVTGDEAIRIYGPPRWRIALAAGDGLTLDQASLWEVIALSLRRGVNSLAVWDPVRPIPRGTVRGTLTLNALCTAGSNTMQIAGAGTGQLKAGDWLQVGTGIGDSQLVKIMADVAAVSGVITATFEPACRDGFVSGTTVIWDHPVVYTRQIGKSAKWEYNAGNLLVNGFAFDLIEQLSA